MTDIALEPQPCCEAGLLEDTGPRSEGLRGWRRVCSFPVLLVVILGGMVFLFSRRGIADPDIWWHLRNADFLVSHGAMVRHDMYSFTTANAPWINHEWLSELPYYFAWKAMGIRGLYLVLFLTVEVILTGVFYLAYLVSKNVKASFLACSFAVVLATVSFGPRTLLFGWVLLVAELILLVQFKSGKDHLWLLPILFAVWVNTHGSWLIGMVLLFLFVASGLVEGQWGRIEATRWSPSQLVKLASVLLLSVVALFFNPYTYHLVFYPFDLAFRQTLNVSHVSEWQSLNFHEVRGKIVFGMLALTILIGLGRKTKWDLYAVAFVVLGFYSAMTYSRFTFLLAIVVTPILAREMNFLPPYRPEIDKPILNGLVIAAIVAGCCWQFPSSEFLMSKTVEDYPVKALAYLQQFHPQGRVLNDYLWGGYLILNTPHIPVFVDSRVDIFDHAGVFGDYLDLMGVKRPFEVLDKYNIRYVIYRRESPFAYLLLHSTQWKTDYDDGTAVVLERRDETVTSGPPRPSEPTATKCLTQNCDESGVQGTIEANAK